MVQRARESESADSTVLNDVDKAVLNRLLEDNPEYLTNEQVQRLLGQTAKIDEENQRQKLEYEANLPGSQKFSSNFMKFIGNFESESGAYLKKFQDLLTSTLLSASNTLESLSLAIQDSLNVASRSGYQLKSSSSYTNVTLPSDYVSAFLTPLISSIKSPSTFSKVTSPRLISSASSGIRSGGERKRDILKASENIRGTKIYEERKPVILKAMDAARMPVERAGEAVKTLKGEERGYRTKRVIKRFEGGVGGLGKVIERRREEVRALKGGGSGAKEEERVAPFDCEVVCDLLLSNAEWIPVEMSPETLEEVSGEIFDVKFMEGDEGKEKLYEIEERFGVDLMGWYDGRLDDKSSQTSQPKAKANVKVKATTAEPAASAGGTRKLSDPIPYSELLDDPSPLSGPSPVTPPVSISDVEILDESFTSPPPSDVSVVNSDVDVVNSIPETLSSSSSSSSFDAPPSSKSAALTRKVDLFGEAAIRALDLTFYVAEKVVEETPKVKEEVKRVGVRVEEGLKDGDGEVGWKVS
ncbi:hypothetical protein TrST_g8328 [Triparma strigata]|uniref:Uncharacterized protein n=1 Tax=Triparma strigata TaxID=1606541 RepID=A0A9W7F0Z5_9STRA|nr:hypothetical protein TrST_g8328 [Triparma strigata]